jgi:hypothetical protein
MIFSPSLLPILREFPVAPDAGPPEATATNADAIPLAG